MQTPHFLGTGTSSTKGRRGLGMADHRPLIGIRAPIICMQVVTETTLKGTCFRNGQPLTMSQQSLEQMVRIDPRQGTSY